MMIKKNHINHKNKRSVKSLKASSLMIDVDLFDSQETKPIIHFHRNDDNEKQINHKNQRFIKSLKASSLMINVEKIEALYACINMRNSHIRKFIPKSLQIDFIFAA